MELVKNYIANGEKVIASIAPSYKELLKCKRIDQVKGTLRQLGFFDVREIAEGVNMVAGEYARLLRKGEMENIITTCCPSVNHLIEIYYPQLMPYLARVVSPMVAHGMMLKREYGYDAKVVFIGPCIAKKEESQDPRYSQHIDAVILFDELRNWLRNENLEISKCDNESFDCVVPKCNRSSPLTSGVVNSALATVGCVDGYRRFYVHGIQNCMDLCERMTRGEIKGCFIEMDHCSGGCIKGSAVGD